MMHRLLGFANEQTPELLALGRRLTADPSQWPLHVDTPHVWVEFLRGIGVHDGLPLTQTPVYSGKGYALNPREISRMLGLHPTVADAWTIDVGKEWDGGSHRKTQYKFALPMTILPAAGEVEMLATEAREIYAELIALGLDIWPDTVFTVRLSRPGRSSDHHNVHYWPTPVASYLREGSWIPIAHTQDDDGRPRFGRCDRTWLAGGGHQLPDFVPHIVPTVRRRLANSATARERLSDLGLRIWGDERHSGDVLRDFPVYLDSRYVAAHYATTFKRHYRQAWEKLVRGAVAWPWPSDQTGTVVTTVGALMKSTSLDNQISILVPDDLDATKQSLFALTPHRILVAEPADGFKLAELMKQHHDSVTLTSEVSIEVYGDEQHIEPSAEHALLVTEDRSWIATIIALVAELKSGPFSHDSERSISRIIQRLHMIRVVRVDSVRLIIGGDEMDPPPHTTSLPIDDEVAPTIVVWPAGAPIYEELEHCAPAIGGLVARPSLADPFALACTRLAQADVSSTTAISDDMLARVLQASPEQVQETRAGLRGPVADLLGRVRILLRYLTTPVDLDRFDLLVRDATDAAAVTAALAPWAEVLPCPSYELVQLCRRHASVADLRDALSLDFEKFNFALTHTDPPHPALQHPDRHERSLVTFVDQNAAAILDRLREAYAPQAHARADLTNYGAARNHDGLSPDPQWLDRYATPPQQLIADHVGNWLMGHGASADLTQPSTLPEVEALRASNFQRLEHILNGAEPRVRAWCRLNGYPLPPAWNSPLVGARSALEACYLADFEYLSPEELLAVIERALGWPDHMTRTLDLTALGLTDADLLSKQATNIDETRRRQHELSHIRLDGREVSVSFEHLTELAEAVARGITEEMLDLSGKVALKEVPARVDSGQHSGAIKPGLTVAAIRGLSDDQRTGIGLAGEIVAKGWLERRYAHVEWVSGYRNILLGDNQGSDSNGYDFRVKTGSGRYRYFEVKALTGEARELAEFELGESEVIAAQLHKKNYRILLVTAALDPSSRDFFDLPNPLSTSGRGRYTLVGRGLRYRCAFDL